MAGAGAKILVLNPGSSSLKFRLYDRGRVTEEGVIEEINKNYSGAVSKVIRKIEKYNMDKIEKVVYRIVHGGNLKSPMRLNPALLGNLKKLEVLAPLHMPPAIKVIEIFMKKIKAKHIACFDTSFHSGIPETAGRYAIPRKMADKYGIKRYGFHGTSHEWMLKKAEKIGGKKYEKVISCQLGNGASICAIKNGKSVDTSMGFTPLEGLMMGTRSGDLDPAIIGYLSKKENKTASEIVKMLENESGLKGISGISDVRVLLKRERKNDKNAELALNMFAYRAKKYIGAYIAVLGGVDLIVLGGGISRAPSMRKKILSELEELGIILDEKEVEKVAPVKISKGKVEVFALETDEQEAMLEMTKKM